MATKVLSFACTTAHEVAEHVAQTLAYSETQGVGWLRAALLFIDLMPRPEQPGPGAVPRVVLRVDDEDAARMLGVDRWVQVHTLEMCATHMLRLRATGPLLTGTGSENGPAPTNMEIAKRLAELLLLICRQLSDVARGDKTGLVLCFAHCVHEARPPPLNEAQCVGLMELADAWRDHIVSTWHHHHPSALPALRRISPLPPLTETVVHEDDPPPLRQPKLDPEEFPALGEPPRPASPRAPHGYSKARSPPGLGPTRRATHVPKVRRDDAEALRGVAWLGDPKCNEGPWLRRGPPPQTVAGGVEPASKLSPCTCADVYWW